jgi:hypothetical protein
MWRAGPFAISDELPLDIAPQSPKEGAAHSRGEEWQKRDVKYRDSPPAGLANSARRKSVPARRYLAVEHYPVMPAVG